MAQPIVAITKDRKADNQRPLSSVAVTKRTPQQLPQAEADEVAGDRQLHLPVRGLEGLGHQRQGRQVHVSGDVAESHERAENDEHAQRHVILGICSRRLLWGFRTRERGDGGGHRIAFMLAVRAVGRLSENAIHLSGAVGSNGADARLGPAI